MSILGIFEKINSITTFIFSWLGMILRGCLCALDWNANVDRPHKLDENKKPMYREKI